MRGRQVWTGDSAPNRLCSANVLLSGSSVFLLCKVPKRVKWTDKEFLSTLLLFRGHQFCLYLSIKMIAASTSHFCWECCLSASIQRPSPGEGRVCTFVPRYLCFTPHSPATRSRCCGPAIPLPYARLHSVTCRPSYQGYSVNPCPSISPINAD